ncbi:hypothetical protein D3C77_154600 [compost metagenome]
MEQAYFINRARFLQRSQNWQFGIPEEIVQLQAALGHDIHGAAKVGSARRIHRAEKAGDGQRTLLRGTIQRAAFTSATLGLADDG